MWALFTQGLKLGHFVALAFQFVAGCVGAGPAELPAVPAWAPGELLTGLTSESQAKPQVTS